MLLEHLQYVLWHLELKKLRFENVMQLQQFSWLKPNQEEFLDNRRSQGHLYERLLFIYGPF